MEPAYASVPGTWFKGSLRTPPPEAVRCELSRPVDVPDPVTFEKEPLAPAKFPAPPVTVIDPVAVEDWPRDGTRKPTGIVIWPVSASPLVKSIAKSPVTVPVDPMLIRFAVPETYRLAGRLAGPIPLRFAIPLKVRVKFAPAEVATPSPANESVTGVPCWARAKGGKKIRRITNQTLIITTLITPQVQARVRRRLGSVRIIDIR
jgi:hypothetical protein